MTKDQFIEAMEELEKQVPWEQTYLVRRLKEILLDGLEPNPQPATPPSS